MRQQPASVSANMPVKRQRVARRDTHRCVLLQVVACLIASLGAMASANSSAHDGASADTIQAGRSVDWSALATGDLRAVQELLRDNHPGSVDSGNPRFADWLKRGAADTLPLARTARSRSTYEYVLRVYTNGFADRHLRVEFPSKNIDLWPGFLTRTDAHGATSVTVTSPGVPVPLGATLLGCDGEDVAALLQARVRRPLANPAIPQDLVLTSPWLMVAAADDPDSQLKRCRFDVGGTQQDADLHWQTIKDAALQQRITQAQGVPRLQLGTRQVSGVWFISIPSFNWTGDRVAEMRGFVDSLEQQASTLHDARHVLIDLRGNRGGSSAWGEDVASALWGRDHVRAVASSFDSTVDWRVSERNARAVQSDAASFRASGQPDSATEFSGVADRMVAIAGTGVTLLPEHSPGTPLSAPFPSPFRHTVYVLTDPNCASACLNFMDLLRRFPGVVQVGQPTSADTTYNELAYAPLPSGRATLAYAMKVYRNGTRRNNEWYDPAIAWPGGAMTDEAVAGWIATMP